VIASLVPPSVLVTHKAPYLLLVKGDERDEAYLLGVLSSVPFDWYARRFVELTLTFQLLLSFPTPRPQRDDPLRCRIETIAGSLAAIDDRYAHWAKAVGVPVGGVRDEIEKDDAIAELDALVARLYGLDEDGVKHVFETFHEGWNYGPRLERVLAHFGGIG
jgi:hypothetical protein